MKPSSPSHSGSPLFLSPALSYSMLEQVKDWTVLPLELIQLIVKKLADVINFIRFRATCKTWRSSAPLSDPPLLFPWFLKLLPGRYYCTYGPPGIKQRFYSVSSCQTLTIPLTLNQSQRSQRLWSPMLKGFFSHYLTFADKHEKILSFLNPLTKNQFSLPWPDLCPYASWMVWTGTDPIRNRIINLTEIGRWACYDPHSNKWVKQKGHFYNSCYWQGMFFSTCTGCATEVFDAFSKKLLHNIPPPKDEFPKNDSFDKDDLPCLLHKSYLVESLGIILRVSWFYDSWGTKIVEDSIFHIYRLEFNGLDGQPCWVRVYNIGNQILFLEDTTGFSMTARPSTGFREGCIYFIIQGCEDKPYVHDILAGTVERVPCPFQNCTWFIPGLC